MNTSRHSAHSGYSDNSISGASYSVTPGTPAGYYIAAVIPEWSNKVEKKAITPESMPE